MTKEEHYRKLERMYASTLMNKYHGSTIRISKGSAEVTIPVRREFFHPGDAVHGSVYFKTLDEAAVFAAQSLVEDMFMVTVSFNMYLIRPVSEGEMKATGRVVYRSRRVFIACSELTDSNGQEIARGSGTFMPSKIPLSPEISYE